MDLLSDLKHGNNNEAYELLKQLELQSSQSNVLYPYFEDFIALLQSDRSYVRIRGFRLACAQAPWDIEDKIERYLDTMLKLLEDDRAIIVRQCFAALHIVVLYKSNVCEKIEDKLKQMDLSKYRDSMIPLLEKDMEELRKALC